MHLMMHAELNFFTGTHMAWNFSIAFLLYTPSQEPKENGAYDCTGGIWRFIML